MPNMMIRIMIAITPPRAGPVIEYDQLMLTMANTICGIVSDGSPDSRTDTSLRTSA